MLESEREVTYPGIKENILMCFRLKLLNNTNINNILGFANPLNAEIQYLPNLKVIIHY